MISKRRISHPRNLSRLAKFYFMVGAAVLILWGISYLWMYTVGFHPRDLGQNRSRNVFVSSYVGVLRLFVTGQYWYGPPENWPLSRSSGPAEFTATSCSKVPRKAFLDEEHPNSFHGLLAFKVDKQSWTSPDGPHDEMYWVGDLPLWVLVVICWTPAALQLLR